MANYYGVARSNYFKVKNIEKFSEEISHFDAHLSIDEDAVAILFDESIVGLEYEVNGLSLEDVIVRNLENGEICCLTEIGHEKLRYVGGYIYCIASDGETFTKSLEEMAWEFVNRKKNEVKV